MTSEVKAVLFDAHGVLYDRHESPAQVAARLLVAEGYSSALAPETTHELRALNDEASCGRVSHDAYWDIYLRRHGVESPVDRDRLRARIVEQAQQVVVMPGAVETVTVLKARGLGLGIVTDTMYPLAWKLAWLAEVGLGGCFDAVACSTAVGTRKPAPAIYQHALDALGLGAGDVAFVGHDARELEGARRVGLTTVAVNYDPGAQADYVLATLSDLLALPIVPQR
jgi:HAD superfamily hydrolase (TIGR01509 family)